MGINFRLVGDDCQAKGPLVQRGLSKINLIFDWGIAGKCCDFACNVLESLILLHNPSVSFADSSLYTREPLGAPRTSVLNENLSSLFFWECYGMMAIKEVYQHDEFSKADPGG